MNCARARHALPELAAWRSLAGDGDDGKFADVATHVAQCAACRAALASLQANLAQADALLAEDVKPLPSPDFAARVRERIRAEESHGAGSNMWDWLRAGPAWRFAIPMAAAAVLVAVVLSRVATSPAPAGNPPVGEAARLAVQPANPVQATAPAVAGVGNSGSGVAAATNPRRTPPLHVVVTPGQMDAIWKLYRASRKQQLNGESLVAERASLEEALRPIALASIEPRRMEVPPIEEGQSEKGAPPSSEKAGPGAEPKR